MIVWRPDLPESSDGRPLASTMADLLPQGFDYDRLPNSSSSSLTSLLMRPEVVLALLVFYLVSKTPLKKLRDSTIALEDANNSNKDNKSSSSSTALFRSFVAVHNLALAIFSGVTAWNSWGIVIQHYRDFGFMAIYCDKDGSLWQNGLGAWSTIFYFSKYYEFIDTWILVWKGKEASFLQVYHHTGIAFTMWAAVASQSAWLLFVVLLNSAIHTIMYAYYFIKTVAPHVEIKAARYLTMAQIGQFLTGIACTIGVFVMGSDCDTESSIFALACLHIYGFGLIALFFAFAKRKYKKQ